MIACPRCRTIQPAENMNTGVLNHCPGCGVLLKGDVFPAFYRRQEQAPGFDVLSEQGTAECFNHPGRPAVVPCATCGRLLCGLCEIKFEGKSLCVQCLQSGKEKKEISSLENKHFLFDNLALALAFWPMFFVFPTLVTAPAVLFIVVKYWKQPCSILSRSRIRFVIAALLAVVQLMGWGGYFMGFLE